MSNHLLPALAFAQAMKMSLTIPVMACAPDVFAAIMRQAAQRTANPEQALKTLENLDYTSDIDRWWALCELKAHGATLPTDQRESGQR